MSLLIHPCVLIYLSKRSIHDWMVFVRQIKHWMYVSLTFNCCNESSFILCQSKWILVMASTYVNCAARIQWFLVTFHKLYSSGCNVQTFTFLYSACIINLTMLYTILIYVLVLSQCWHRMPFLFSNLSRSIPLSLVPSLSFSLCVCVVFNMQRSSFSSFFCSKVFLFVLSNVKSN